MTARRQLAPGMLYGLELNHQTVGGSPAMARARARPIVRSVVLESVQRRDAAQRLSLAYALLARMLPVPGCAGRTEAAPVPREGSPGGRLRPEEGGG
jgi:hypothetical protein